MRGHDRYPPRGLMLNWLARRMEKVKVKGGPHKAQNRAFNYELGIVAKNRKN